MAIGGIRTCICSQSLSRCLHAWSTGHAFGSKRVSCSGKCPLPRNLFYCLCRTHSLMSMCVAKKSSVTNAQAITHHSNSSQLFWCGEHHWNEMSSDFLLSAQQELTTKTKTSQKYPKEKWVNKIITSTESLITYSTSKCRTTTQLNTHLMEGNHSSENTMRQ